MTSKYRSRKITILAPDGTLLIFDSQKEANRYVRLTILQRAGQISELRRQVRYPLIPGQRRPDGKWERGVDYIADFVYLDSEGDTVVEDAKGFRTPEYIIKRKLMLHIHSIAVMEV